MRVIRGDRHYGKTCLHATSIMLGLGHPDVKSSLLISGSGCCNCSTGLLVGTVDGQLIKCDLGLGGRAECIECPGIKMKL